MDRTSAACTDTGSGTVAAPFCTIQAAANVVVPGQTVLIGGIQAYDEDVKVKTSGTTAAPITFAASATDFNVDPPDHAFTLNGVSNIIIKGLSAYSPGDAVLVSGSSNITIENSTLQLGLSGATTAIADIHVTGASSAVSLVRDRLDSSFGPYGSDIRVDGGSTGTVIATDSFHSFGQLGIAVVGATGTEIAGNTLTNSGACGIGISVTSAAASTSIENNVITGLSSPFSTPACTAGSTVGLLVSADSATTTSAQYNALSTDYSTQPYQWAGVPYYAAADFQAATGKGSQDIVEESIDLSASAIPSASPLIDSADATAPGETSTDIFGNARVDDPDIANTGTGSGYYDRGAVEYQEYTSSSMSLTYGSPQYVFASVHLQGIPWGSSITETFDWGDGTAKQTFADPGSDTVTDYTNFFGGSHVYVSRGTYTVTETLTDAAGTKTLTGQFISTGSTYQPVAPTRVLDTRNGTGTGGKTAPVPAQSAIAVNVTSGVSGAPAASSITAVVLNVTVVTPTANGYITAYPDGTALPNASNLNFSAGETVPNLVTMMVGADGKVALYNGAKGTAHLGAVAD